MMSEKKNIDRLFQEKFKDFEVLPAENVWSGIEAKLKEKKKERKVIPIWFKMAGVAAALIIGMLIFVGPGTNFGNGANEIVTQPSTTNSEIQNNDALVETDKVETEQQEKMKTLEPVKENGYATAPDIRNTADDDANQEKSSKTHRRPANFIKNSSGNLRHVKSDAATAIAKTEDLQNNKNSTDVIQNPQSQITASGKTDTEKSIIPEQKRISASVSEEKSQIVQNNSAKNTVEKTTDVSQNNGIKNTIVDQAADEKKLDTAAIATVVPNALEELLNEKENKSVAKNEPKLNRWQISTNVAPIYFSSTSNNSPIDSRLAQNSKDFNTDLAYGIGVRYSINKKITLRTGVNTIGMEQTTKDLEFAQTSNARSLAHVDPNIRGQMIQIDSKIADPNGMAPDPVNGRKFSSSISQRTGYIEVPLEMSYKLIDKKLTVEVIGGFSTLFLNENSVALLSSGLDMEIGKATNLNDMHFSTNLGVGLRYNFLKSFQFNVEPMFKYQLNTYTNSSNINPYMFGLYTGVSYRF